MNQISVLLTEVTKIPNMSPKDNIGSNQMVVNLPLATGSNMKPDQDGFYACSYVIGDKLLSHRVTDSSENKVLLSAQLSTDHNNEKFCKVVLGAPLSIVVDQHPCLMPRPIKYNLVSKQLQTVGLKNFTGKQITDMIHKGAKECAKPCWTPEKWEKDVFSNFIGCSIQHEDAETLKLLDDEDYACISFTHQSSKGLIKLAENPGSGFFSVKEFVSSIMSIHEGAAPGITKVHARRVIEVPPYVGMDMKKYNLKTFDHNKVQTASNCC